MDKILIIDDSLLQSKMLNKILLDHYTTMIIHQSLESVEAAAQFQPSIILLDVIMPVKNGFEVLADLKNDERTKAIPVIMITSLSDMGNEEKGLKLGAVDYIIKPFNEPIVMARIQTHIKLYNYQKAIEQLAMLDPLTGLFNRRAYEGRGRIQWENAFKRQSDLSIAMLDIDFFKQYNDNFGHPAGDVLLKEIASILSKHLNTGHGMAARYGGEEFLFLMPRLNAREAFFICESVRKEIESMGITNILPSGASSPLTVSIGGVTLVPRMAFSLEDCVEEADVMLYKAKNSGKNLVLWKQI